MNLILQRVDDSELIRRIDTANSSVALYAPGVSVAVAWALHRAAWRLGGAIKVVLDVSIRKLIAPPSLFFALLFENVRFSKTFSLALLQI